MPTYCLLTLFLFPRHSFNMGVQGVFAYLLEHGFEGEQVGPSSRRHPHPSGRPLYVLFLHRRNDDVASIPRCLRTK